MEDWFEAMPWKDWGAAIITGLFTVIGVAATITHKLTEGRRTRQAEQEREEQERQDEERKTERLADIANTQDLTARFRTLMDGYEGRIRDLTNEMASLRQEMKEIRRQFEVHQSVCRGCPHFEERMRYARTAS